MARHIRLRHCKAGTPYDELIVTAAAQIDLWTIELDQAPELMASFDDLLSPSERARAARFVYPHDRAHFIAAHAALRQILAAALHTSASALAFEQGTHGKPALADRPLHFNLSHAAGRALLAVSPTLELGVDLERIRLFPDMLGLAQNFAPGERTRLKALAASPELALAFFQCWTRKEAFVKALGTGLAYPLDSFEVTFHPSPQIELRGPGTEPWQLRDVPQPPDFAAALCYPRLAIAPTFRALTWQP